MTIRKLISAVIITALFPLVAFSQTDKKSTVKDTREYVDLGLPSGTLWATCNIGASKPEECGLYFAWGETEGYTSDTSDGHYFDAKNHKWWSYGGKDPVLTKYCSSMHRGKIDNKFELDPEDDAATVIWGNKWEMPSSDQVGELCDSSYTISEWTTLNGVRGKKITSKKNGKSIFLPAAGFRTESWKGAFKSVGFYWSRTIYNGDFNAYCLIFDKAGIECYAIPRHNGICIRPVRSPKNKKKAKLEITEGDAMVVPIEDDQLIIIQSEPDEK